jgi:tRNA 2-thiouridine synthesizing protein E
MPLEFEGRLIETDRLGYLLDPDQWERGMAERLAAREGVALGPEHWCLIEFVRDWYETHHALPEARHLLRAMRDLLGAEKASRRYLHHLFPYGYGPQLCKIAGMTMPRKIMLDV